MNPFLRRTIALASGIGVLSASLFASVLPAAADATIIGRGTNVSLASCDADVAVVGLRGSGQDKTNTYKYKSWWMGGLASNTSYDVFQGWPAQSEGKLATDQIEGFSNEVASAAFGLRQRFPDSLKMSYIPVEYPAVDISQALLPTYPKSYEDGAQKLKDTVNGLVQNCGDHLKIAIIGFSQGAQATHEGLSLISPENRKHIASVILIADPERDTADTTALNYNDEGTTVTPQPSPIVGAGFGVFSASVPSRPEVHKLPEDLKGRVLSVCYPYDPVCNSSATAFPGAAEYAYGFTVHGNTYQDKNRPNLYDIPADWSHDRVADALLGKDSATHNSTPNVYAQLSQTIKCPAVNFISAGSSDDSKTGGEPAQIGHGGIFFGLGADLPASYLWAVKDAAPKTDIGIKWINYPAMKPTGLLDRDTGNADYNKSVNDGVQVVLKTVDSMAKECPDTAMVLFGDEQGAQVMHEASIELDKAGRADKIKAVWLVSDPTRTGDDPTVVEYSGDPSSMAQLVGGKPLSTNGGYLKPYAQKNGTAGLPSALSGRVYSVCFTNDSMCNPQPDTKAENVASFGNYISFSGLWKEPAQWVANQLR